MQPALHWEIAERKQGEHKGRAAPSAKWRRISKSPGWTLFECGRFVRTHRCRDDESSILVSGPVSRRAPPRR